MVKDEQLKNMASRSGVDISDDTKFTAFKEALTSDTEVEVTMPETWHTFSEDAIGTRDKSKYEEGKSAGLEMEIKKFKTDNKLEFEGKDLSKLVAHVKTEAEKAAGAAPEAKYKELETKYTSLVTTNEGLSTTLKQKENELLSFGAKSSLNTALASKGLKTTIPADNIVTLFMSEYEIVDGKHAKKKGAADIVKDDKTLAGVPHTDVFLTYAETFKTKDGIDPIRDNGKDGKDKLFTKISDFNEWKRTSKPDAEVADKVLIKSAKAAGTDFYKD